MKALKYDDPWWVLNSTVTISVYRQITVIHLVDLRFCGFLMEKKNKGCN